MHPVLIDLSQWKPLGVGLDTFTAKVIAFAVFASIGYALGILLGRRRQRPGATWADPITLACVAGLGCVALGMVWVVAKVHSYGMMMALGFLAAMGVGRWLIRRRGEDPEAISNVGVLALIGGVIGSRIMYILEKYEAFGSIAPDGSRRTLAEQVIEMFKLTSGGLIFDGGLMLAVVLVLGYLLAKRYPVRRFLDVLAICAVLGLAFGRTGCLLNGCCYGDATNDHFALSIQFPYAGVPVVYPHSDGGPYPPGATPSPVYAQQHALDRRLQTPAELTKSAGGGRTYLKYPGELASEAEFAAAAGAWSLPVHPAQVYGIVNALVLTGLLLAVSRLRTREGQVFAMLFVFYPLTRFILEFIRDDNPGRTITPAQVKCLILVGAGAALMFALRKIPASCGPALAERMVAAAKREAAPPPEGRRKRRKRR